MTIPTRKWVQRTDLLANLLTVAVAIIFLSLITYRYLIPTSSNLGLEHSAIGTRFGVGQLSPTFDPAKTEKSLLLVLMKGCRFCEASMGFYASLLKESRDRRDIQLIIIFPERTNREDVEPYLSKYGLAGAAVSFVQLEDIDVSATPTLIAVDSRGEVKRGWVGLLDSAQEAEVKKFVFSN